MKKLSRYLAIVILDIAAIILIGLQIKFWGWLLLLLGVFFLFFCDKQFRKDFFLIYLCLAILGVTQINTSISYSHMLEMGFFLSLALIVPYTISRFVFKNHHVKYQFHHGRRWTRNEIFYIFLAFILPYFVFPFMLRNTGSYHNWAVPPGTENLVLLFIGTNALGIWDELFFVNTVLGILRRYMSFPVANFVQSIMFTSFLYELGFRGWAFLVIFIFALLQGYVFKKTESLLYVITIHLAADLVLYLTLISLHHPDWLHIFVT